MDPTILLVALILLPIVLLTLLRINAVLVFLSLCLGSVISQFISKDPSVLLDGLQTVPGQSVQIEDATLKLFLLLTPPILTMIFMINTVKGKTKLLFNLIPAIGVGLLLPLLMVPLLPGDLGDGIESSMLWTQGQQAQNLIVGVTAVTSLMVLWVIRPHFGRHKKHSKNKH